MSILALALAVEVFAQDGSVPGFDRFRFTSAVDDLAVASESSVRQTKTAATAATAPAAAATDAGCSDPAFSFLDPKCQHTWKRHAARPHRVATWVLGRADVPASPSQSPVVATNPPAQVKRPTLAAAPSPVRRSAPGKPMTIATVGTTAAD